MTNVYYEFKRTIDVQFLYSGFMFLFLAVAVIFTGEGRASLTCFMWGLVIGTVIVGVSFKQNLWLTIFTVTLFILEALTFSLYKHSSFAEHFTIYSAINIVIGFVLRR